MKKKANPQKTENKSTTTTFIQNEDFKSEKELSRFISVLPSYIMILNEKREIVCASNKILSAFNDAAISQLSGLLPGDIINCEHPSAEIKECGKTSFCKHCATNYVINKSGKTKESITRECQIISTQNNERRYMNFEVTASPFILKEKNYTILWFRDINEKIRKRQLERIFFHDILNTAGNIQNLLDLLKANKSPEESDEIIKITEQAGKDLFDEIMSQKQLSDAENGELEINIRELQSLPLMKGILDQFSGIEGLQPKLELSPESEDLLFYSDRNLILRILKNMVKNAMEASGLNDTIVLSCKKRKEVIRFSVHNPSFIPEEIQKQIFHRSFSTKNPSRGFGTYSMKLLGEKYLSGKVHFTTSEEKGTFFVLNLPLYFPDKQGS